MQAGECRQEEMMSEDAGRRNWQAAGWRNKLSKEMSGKSIWAFLSNCAEETSVWESWQMDIENQSCAFSCDVHTHVHAHGRSNTPQKKLCPMISSKRQVRLCDESIFIQTSCSGITLIAPPTFAVTVSHCGFFLSPSQMNVDSRWSLTSFHYHHTALLTSYCLWLADFIWEGSRPMWVCACSACEVILLRRIKKSF